MVKMTKQVIIVEGCDGSGKSTFARKLAQELDAVYAHHAPYLEAEGPLARLYYESMLPALLGYQHVVLDRSWLSEPIYGKVMRGGANRIGSVHQRMLERAALRCGAVVIVTDTPWEVCASTYKKRTEGEYVSSLSRLREVHSAYQVLWEKTALPMLRYDWTLWHRTYIALDYLIEQVRHTTTGLHPLSVRSAGAWRAECLVVGDSFADPKAGDSLYQLPFVSWSQAGCSYWFTEQLAQRGISESQLLWVNAHGLEHDLTRLLQRWYPATAGAPDRDARSVIALGKHAAAALRAHGVAHTELQHPQYRKRFKHKERWLALDAALGMGKRTAHALEDAAV